MTMYKEAAEINALYDKAFAQPAMRGLDSQQARIMLTAIAFQESRFKHRRQLPLREGAPFGPANGFWQFERGGGVKGVLNHPATKLRASELCAQHGVTPLAMNVWKMLPEIDLLACGFARLLLYSDAAPLPKVGDQSGAWGYYIRNWRPGKPHLKTWADCYGKALKAHKDKNA